MKVFGLAVLSFLLLLTLVDLDESGVLAKKGNQAKCPSKSKRGNKKQKKGRGGASAGGGGSSSCEADGGGCCCVAMPSKPCCANSDSKESTTAGSAVLGGGMIGGGGVGGIPGAMNIGGTLIIPIPLPKPSTSKPPPPIMSMMMPPSSQPAPPSPAPTSTPSSGSDTGGANDMVMMMPGVVEANGPGMSQSGPAGGGGGGGGGGMPGSSDGLIVQPIPQGGVVIAGNVNGPPSISPAGGGTSGGSPSLPSAGSGFGGSGSSAAAAGSHSQPSSSPSQGSGDTKGIDFVAIVKPKDKGGAAGGSSSSGSAPAQPQKNVEPVDPLNPPWDVVIPHVNEPPYMRWPGKGIHPPAADSLPPMDYDHAFMKYPGGDPSDMITDYPDPMAMKLIPPDINGWTEADNDTHNGHDQMGTEDPGMLETVDPHPGPVKGWGGHVDVTFIKHHKKMYQPVTEAHGKVETIDPLPGPVKGVGGHIGLTLVKHQKKMYEPVTEAPGKLETIEPHPGPVKNWGGHVDVTFIKHHKKMYEPVTTAPGMLKTTEPQTLGPVNKGSKVGGGRQHALLSIVKNYENMIGKVKEVYSTPKPDTDLPPVKQSDNVTPSNGRGVYIHVSSKDGKKTVGTSGIQPIVTKQQFVNALDSLIKKPGGEKPAAAP